MVSIFAAVLSEVLKNTFFLFGYVSNINSFPQPLSVEEEQKYLNQYKQGDEDARNVLIERNLRLVAHIVKKYNVNAGECDDLISIGTIGLIKAISTFDQDKGTRLATYAARCIEKAMLTLWLEPAFRLFPIVFAAPIVSNLLPQNYNKNKKINSHLRQLITFVGLWAKPTLVPERINNPF